MSALIGGWLGFGVAQAEPVPLESIVERLTEQGHAILFSTDLVEAGTRIEVPDGATINLATLRRALPELGLELQRVDDYWVIAPAPAVADNAPGLRLESRDGFLLEGVEAQWRDRVYALEDDGEGLYALPLPMGTLVSVRADNHRPTLARLGTDPVRVVLVPVRMVENVIVTGTRHRLSGRNVTGAVSTLTAEDLATIPSLGGDALRAAAQLPGMSSVGVSAKPQIRGGVQDELLVRVDGIELLDAYHLADFQNLFSIVDDRSVEAVDVYTGGFPARYGNRMSGVMEITTGSTDETPRTELGLSVFSVLANTHGYVNDGKTEYLASLRRGNLDLVTKQVSPKLGRPRYHDAFGRISHKVSKNVRLSTGGFLTQDDVTLQEDETSASSKIDSRYLWTRLEADHGEGLSSSNTLTYTWSERSKFLDDLDEDTGAGGFLDHEQTLWKVNASTEVTLERPSILMEFGLQAEYGQATYDSLAVVDRGVVGETLSGRSVRRHDIHINPDGWSGGAYWAGEFQITDKLLLQPGLRWDIQDFDPADTTEHFSPRLGLRYQPTQLLELHFGAGRFYQPDALQELQVTDGVTQFFRPQQSDHFIAGAEWLPSARWEMRLDVYEKRYNRTRQRFENLFNPFVMVPELEPDRIVVSPDRARARGVDVEARHYFTEAASAVLRYSHMDAEDRIDGRWVPRRWSQKHTANALLSWRGERLTAALSFTWHSGWRGTTLPSEVPEGTVLDASRLLNNTDLKDYVSLDFSIRRTWDLPRAQLTAFASVTNLLGRKNLAGQDYDPEEDDGVILFERTLEYLIPTVPSVGILLSF